MNFAFAYSLVGVLAYSRDIHVHRLKYDTLYVYRAYIEVVS